MAANTRITDFRVSIGVMNNRKIKRLRRELGAGACWSLVVLWGYCAGNEPDGILTGWTIDDLESAAEWDGEPAAFAAAVTRIGLVDEMQDGGYSVHDWEENQLWIVRAEARSIAARNAAGMRWACDGHADGMRGACGAHQKAMRGASKSDAEHMPPSIPFQTIPNHSKPTKPTKRRRDGKPSLEGFAEFWSAYPRKAGKGRAEQEWAKVPRDAHADISAAIARQILSEDWTRDGGRYIPHPATWLHQRRWEDVVMDYQELDIERRAARLRALG